MRHLSPEQFVDALDGTASGQVLEHAASCAACRQQLDDLKAIAREADAVEVPEPSPLFWDHLSARVRTAVEAEAARHETGSLSWAARFMGHAASWRMLVPLTAAAVLAVALLVRVPPPDRGGVASGAPSPADASSVRSATSLSGPNLDGPAQGIDVADSVDDEPLAFVADLASGLDWTAAAEIGLTPSGGVESTVLDLDEAERAELQRLLNEAIGNGVTM